MPSRRVFSVAGTNSFPLDKLANHLFRPASSQSEPPSCTRQEPGSGLHFFCGIAKLVRHEALNLVCAGSTPAPAANFFLTDYCNKEEISLGYQNF